MAVSATSAQLTGLPRRLVQDGIVTEDVCLQAVEDAKGAGQTLVAYLVDKELADPHQVAVAASHEFGVPLMDLSALELDLDAARSVSQKLLNKHKVLPLLRRGQRMFLGVSDPTNLQAIDEIKFQTGFRIDPVVVEQNKLEELVNSVLEAVDTSMASFDEEDFDLESLEVSGGDEELEMTSRATTSTMRRWCASSTRSCSTPSNAARRISISSPMKRSSGFAPARTAC